MNNETCNKCGVSYDSDYQSCGCDSASVGPVVMPRIWGEWDVQFYGSGTTIVVQKHLARKPHLYIYSDSSADEDRWMKERFDMCYKLKAYMNGVCERPIWLDDIERVSESHATALTGASISAVGPMVDARPPQHFWVTDESESAKNDRARLMDAVFFKA